MWGTVPSKAHMLFDLISYKYQDTGVGIAPHFKDKENTDETFYKQKFIQSSINQYISTYFN